MSEMLSIDPHSITPLDVLADVLVELGCSPAADVSGALAISSADRPLRPLLGAIKHIIRGAPDSATCKYLSRAVGERIFPAKTPGDQKEPLSSVVKLSTRQLQVVGEYIQGNLARAILVEDLAASIGMCRAQFARRFRASTGMTPHQAVTAARIHRAKALLVDRTVSISDVAKRSGFSNGPHLSSVFRQHLKMSPSAYRTQAALIDGPRASANTVDARARCTPLQSPVATRRLGPSSMTAEFGLEQTTLRTGDDVRLIASSQGLGWSDLFAAVTEELPHETLHRAVPDIWLASALTSVDIQRVGARWAHNQVLPKNTITITGSAEAVYDRMVAPLKVAYVYLRRGVIDDVAEQLFSDSRERRNINSLFCSNDVVLQRIIASIRMLLKEPAEGSRLIVEYLSQALAARLLENHSVVGPARSGPLTPAFNSWEIGRIIDYINENLSSNIGIAELAELVGLGRAQFILRFKATTSVTPHQFVILRRVWKARRMLAERGADQALIAQRCGFAGRAHFVTTFGKLVGMTPHQYRLLAIG